MPGAGAGEAGDQQHNASINFNIWGCSAARLCSRSGFNIIPAPWVATSFYGWVIPARSCPAPRRPELHREAARHLVRFGGLALLSYAGPATSSI